MSDIHYQQGFADELREQAAQLYDQAFGSKLGLAIPEQAVRLRLLEQAFLPEYSITALQDGELVGMAGFYGTEGSLTGGMLGGRGMSWAELRKALGVLGTLRAMFALALYTRTPQTGELLMDGIAVRDDMRGRGVGGQLLEHLISYAREQGYHHIRLDVIDTNTGARRLYERKGFVATKTEHFAFLRPILGFSAETTMQRSLK
jgi:GNAT superfamily N-acetyltransferase